MAKGRPNKKAASVKRAIETLANAIDGVADRASIDMWFASWQRVHIAAGERAGRVWLASEYRVPLHAAVRREAGRYRKVLERASPPVTEPGRYAFEQVDEAFAGGFLYAVESFLAEVSALVKPTGTACGAAPGDLNDAEVPH